MRETIKRLLSEMGQHGADVGAVERHLRERYGSMIHFMEDSELKAVLPESVIAVRVMGVLVR